MIFRRRREVWIAGRYIPRPGDREDRPAAWELLGVFTTRARARARCERDTDWIGGPFAVDERFPDAWLDIPNLEYPNREASA